MSIPAHFDDFVPAGRTRPARRTLRLEAHGATAAGEAARVTVHNISTTGLLLESTVPLAVGEPIAIDLPEADATAATVIWASGGYFGCQFDEPVAERALSAAQLRSRPDRNTGLPTTGESLALRLQRLRKARSLTMSQLAATLGVSKPTVWAWEQGKARPVDDRLEAIAAALGVTPGELRPGTASAGIEELLARCREQIAAATGAAADRIRISIEL